MFLSSANGQNWFYRLFLLGKNDKFPAFKSWHMPSTEAPYQDHEMLEIIRQTIPDIVWREEYMCEFMADSGGVFTGLDAIKWEPMLQAPVRGHEMVASIDWGMDGDYTVFKVGDKYERKEVFLERFTSVDPIEQCRRLVVLLKHWNPTICYVETNGIGKPMFKILKKMHDDAYEDSEPTTRLRGVHVNNERKRKLVEDYAAAISFGRFIPLVRENEADTTSPGAIQMSEMSTFMRKRTASGLEVTYGAAEGAHDDTISAGYLLYKGIVYDPLEDTPDAQAASDQPIKKTKKRSPFQRSHHVTRSNRRRTA